MQRIPYKPGCKKYRDAVKKIYGNIPHIPEGWRCTGVGITLGHEYWISTADMEPNGPLGEPLGADPQGRINLMPINEVPMEALKKKKFSGNGIACNG